MSRKLIVLPDDTADAIIKPIGEASKSIDIRMFVFTSRPLLHAVTSAQRRGVTVRVMLNPARRNGVCENEEARRALEDAGVQVRDSSPDFALTHQKSMVIDSEIGFVKSLNWDDRNLTETRDYVVSTRDHSEVSEMVQCFECDWAREPFEPAHNSSLIWCPNNGRARLAAFIDGAKHSLWVQNERYQDMVIIERIVRAVQRGVQVHIMAKPPHKLKAQQLVEAVGGLRILQDVGAKVRQLRHLKLHGKVLVADGSRAIVGSINLAPGSFDSRRELAIETDGKHVVDRLITVFDHDWHHAHELDLSDESLLA